MTIEGPKPGPTGTFDRGAPITPGDRGGLNAMLRLDYEKKIIRMDFFTELSFIAMTADEAVVWGNRLLTAAQKLREGKRKNAEAGNEVQGG